MIDDKSDIKKLIEMCNEENLIDVLFEEEIVHAITTPTLVAHLLETGPMSPGDLFEEAVEYKKMTKQETKEAVEQLTSKYID